MPKPDQLELAYSMDAEGYGLSLWDILNDFFAAVWCKPDLPETIAVHVGIVKRYRASDFMHSTSDLIETMRDNAFEDMPGEYVLDWLEHTASKYLRDLDYRVKKTIDEWADEFGFQPKFFSVEDTTKKVFNVAEVMGAEWVKNWRASR